MKNPNARKRKTKKRSRKGKVFDDLKKVGATTTFTDSKKNLRLSLVARRLNLGLQTIVDILSQNGEIIDSKPNAKLSNSQLAFLENELYQKKFNEPFVKDYTNQLIEDLKLDYKRIFQISPETFENLVIELLSRNKFNVTKVGKTYQKDGGIDIIAIKKDLVTIVVAVQVKHKQGKNVGSGEIRDFAGALSINNFFSAGMLVTNTDFTADSKWIERKLESKIELKNNRDIQNWLLNNFTTRKKSNIDVELGNGVRFKKEV